MATKWFPNPFKDLIRRFIGGSGEKAVDDNTDEMIEEVLDAFLLINKEINKIGVSIMLAGVIFDLEVAVKEIAIVAKGIEAYQVWRKRADRILDKVDTVLNVAEVQALLQGIKRANTIALIISPEYRLRVARLENDIRKISRNVFGEASTIAAQLTVLQMIIYDINRLEGNPPAEGESKFLRESIEVADMVAGNARRYNRNAGEFWVDLQSRFINPASDDLALIERERNSKLDLAVTSLNTVESTLSAVDDRLGDYLRESGPFLEVNKLRALDTMRKDYRRRVLDPLREITEVVNVSFPLVERKVDEVAFKADVNALRLNIAEVATRNPQDMNEAQRKEQRDRYTSIFDNIMRLGTTSNEELTAGMREQSSIFAKLTRE